MYRFGPNQDIGDVRSENTGSQRMLMPLVRDCPEGGRRLELDGAGDGAGDTVVVVGVGGGGSVGVLGDVVGIVGAGDGHVVCIRKLACPIQVTFIKTGSEADCNAAKSILWTGASSDRSDGTGTNAGLSLAKRTLSTLSRPWWVSVNEGQGFRKPVGGLPIWCDLGSLGRREGSGRTVMGMMGQWEEEREREG